MTPENLRIAENATLILPLHRELDALREADGAATRIGTTKRGIGPAYEDKVGRRAIRSWISPTCRRCTARSSGCWRITMRCAAGIGLAGDRRRRRSTTNSPRIAPKVLAVHGLGLVAARRQAARGQAHPVRGRAGRAARHRSRHLSLCDLVQHRRGAGGDRLRARAECHRLRARHLQGLHDARRRGAVSRPTRWTMPSARRSASAAASSAPSPAAPRRCGWFDAVLVRQTVRPAASTASR